jgi:glycosyltransferase involved in cell wall biosynthesis
MADLSAIVLTFNEEKHILRLLENLRGLCRAVYVIDSFSTDKTTELAEAGGAVVLKNKFLNYARQYEWGIANAQVGTQWVLRIDADELLTPGLVREIERTLPILPAEVTGLNMNRRHIFLGRWVRHGGRYPLTLLRIWRRDCAQIEQRWMDEHMRLTHGKTITLRHDFLDHNLNDTTFFTAKHNQYATREAIDQIGKKHGLFNASPPLQIDSTSRQAALKRWMKERVYNQLPLWAGPLGYFLFRITIQLGFLDGREGLIYHVLQGFWYRFLVAAKVFEYEQGISAAIEPAQKVAVLARLTGYPVESFR